MPELSEDVKRALLVSFKESSSKETPLSFLQTQYQD